MDRRFPRRFCFASAFPSPRKNRMSALRLTFLLALSLSVISCATTQPSKTNLVLPKLAAMGVDSGTYTKIANHRVLSYTDIYGLVKKGVPSKVIVTYLL